MFERVLVAGAAVLLVLCATTALPATAQTASSVPAAAAGSASASDQAVLATGKHIWGDAACANCHGANAGGGHSADFPAGPNLRTSGLDPDSMLQMVECGIPDSKMPAWLKGAYTEVSCYGNPTGPVPSGIVVSGAYSEDELKALVAYVQTNFMHQPMPKWQQ
jgi:mono/diheme cytochrome c family protein